MLYLLADSMTGMLAPIAKANNKFIASIVQIINFFLRNVLEISLKNHKIKKLRIINEGIIKKPNK